MGLTNPTHRKAVTIYADDLAKLRARVAELEAEASTLRLLLIEAQRTGTLPLDLNERINAARY